VISVGIALAAVGWIVSLVTIPFILLSNKRPAGVLAWLWAVLLFPYFGAFCYLVFGSERVYRRHLRRRRKAHVRRNEIGEQPLPDGLDKGDSDLGELLSNLNIFSSSRYEEAELLVGGGAFYAALEKLILGARTSIFVEFFIWRNDEYGQRMLKLLVGAARRGVKVCVIVDEMGSLSLPRGFFNELLKAGGKFSWFNALHLLRNRWAFSLRNHRKIQIIDGHTAFVGGMNLGREYMGVDVSHGSWQDMQVRVTGPVVVSLTQTFFEDWHFATKEDLNNALPFKKVVPTTSTSGLVQVVEDGPDSCRHPIIHSSLAILNAAQKSVWIAAGYFFPQEPLLSGLRMAAMRGVDVRILIPAKTDHPYLVIGARSYYEELLSHGVRLFEYSRGTHHAKVVVMDKKWVSIGSANFDIRSMRLNFELNLLFQAPDLASEVVAVLEKDFAHSKEIKLETFKMRSIWVKLAENTSRLLGPVL